MRGGWGVSRGTHATSIASVVGVVVDAQFAAGCREEVVVHGFVDARAVGGEPVGDSAEGGYGAASDSGFFADFALCGFDGGFAVFDVALEVAPLRCPVAVDAGDDGYG